ncbi:acyl-CoA thioesterase [Rhodococcus koreensis]|uniref:acyl-CoA thioesterase n=1 Tax=Rhodococcus koreensis TaxID=99653 RepID=UPI00366CD60A
MPRYTLPLRNNATPDAPASVSRHVPFYCVHEAAAVAWKRALVEACGDLLDPVTQTAVVNVVSNFGRELFTGAADVDVTLDRIGTTSLTFLITLYQDGVQAAELTVVLVHLDSSRVNSTRWSPEQIAAFEALRDARAVA